MIDLDMAPYAAFVWPAWAVTVGVLVAVVGRCLSEARRWKRELERLEGDDR
ncbi:heme exporter protein CcmD [Brevundimonas sp.]|uniref:heme exporter protein CcmD n=1 Tax=Brevundimonas sp. TaxID=1871086 RepID=UPI003AF5973A